MSSSLIYLVNNYWKLLNIKLSTYVHGHRSSGSFYDAFDDDGLLE